MILCCSPGRQGAIFAALIPAVNIIKMLLMGLGIWKDDATVKSMTRDGDYRYVSNQMSLNFKHNGIPVFVVLQFSYYKTTSV